MNNFPFLGTIIQDQARFEEYRSSHKELLDYRYAFESSISNNKGLQLVGICPLTHGITIFKSPISEDEKLSNDNAMPNFKNNQTCTNEINMFQRALAHYATYRSHSQKLGKILLITNRYNDALNNYLKSNSDSFTHTDIDAMGNISGKFDVIIADDTIHQVKDLDKFIKTCHNHMASEAKIYIGLNLHYDDYETIKKESGQNCYWQFGWSIIDILKGHDFLNPNAITFWAIETGYLGSFNFIFEAIKK